MVNRFLVRAGNGVAGEGCAVRKGAILRDANKVFGCCCAAQVVVRKLEAPQVIGAL